MSKIVLYDAIHTKRVLIFQNKFIFRVLKDQITLQNRFAEIHTKR